MNTILIAGGSGHVGQSLRRHFERDGWTVRNLSRTPKGDDILWDGRSLGPWTQALEGVDVVLNLAGRSVNCRYTKRHLREMLDSRVASTRVIGEAIERAAQPPGLWLQASTATIYAHRYDAANDEIDGVIGGTEPGVPTLWAKSIAIALAWEAELARAKTPRTRKVALRSAMTMSRDRGSVFDTLATLARRGLGGAAGSGDQYVSWIHELDFYRSLRFLIEHPELDGPINVAAPNPLPNREFSRILCAAVGAKVALPTPVWLLEIGTFLMRTESELVLKSRRVVPRRLLEAGFSFEYPTWERAAQDLSSD